MFKDYRDYIENIRNNLIQNDIQLPITELEDYRDVFIFSLTLEQVCWFYQRLLLINSEYAVRSVYLYNEDYREKIRQIAYKEFISSLDGYKNISARYYILNKFKKEVGDIEERVDSPTVDVEEEIDLFGDMSNEEVVVEEQEEQVSPKTFLNFVQKSSKTSSDVVNLTQFDGSVIHGIFIDEYNVSNRVSNDSEDKEDTGSFTRGSEEIVHGIFIDEYEVNTEGEEEINEVDVVDNGEIENVVTNTIHGIFIDEWVSDNIEDKNIVEDMHEEVHDVQEACEIHGIYIDEWAREDAQSIRVIPEGSEEVHGTFIDEWKKVSADEDYEEESPWGEVNEYDTEESDSWDDILNEEDTESAGEPRIENRGYDESSHAKANSKPQRDVSDSIQDITNRLLTEGRNLISRGLKGM